MGAPHPLADSGTEAQALALFRDAGAKVFVMAGAHRLASNVLSTCIPAYNRR
jgi:hypothetical protein